MMQKSFIYILLVFRCITLSYAQENKPMRVELEAVANTENYHIVPFGEKGVLLFYQSLTSYTDENITWYFSLYDVNFKEIWTKKYTDNRYMHFRLYNKDNKNLYLFLQKAVNKNQKDDFTILTVDINSGSIKSQKGINPDHSDVNSFVVYNRTAYCSGMTVPTKGAEIGQVFFTLTLVPIFSGITLLKYHPSFFTVNLDNGQIKSIKETLKGQAWVESMEADSIRNCLLLTIKNHIYPSQNYMYLNQYTPDGAQTASMELKTNDPKRKLNTAKLLSFNDSTEIIIGTYNTRVKGHNANAANLAFKEPSSGIYFTKLVHGVQKNISFYNFSALKSFYASLNDKNAFRMKKMAMRKKAKGQEISLDYSLLLHDIIVRDKQFVFIAEAYYPEYHEVSYTTYDAYGRPSTSSYSVFDGYRYTHAIIACFDTDGKLVWDNSFEMTNILANALGERVQTLFDGDDIILTYSNDGQIASKVIEGDKVIENKNYTDIKTNYNNDKVISDYNSDMEYWYDNYFISYGYQRIKNTSIDAKSKRTVFYFNKISFN
ncbi:MAG: hypothetical protein WCQ95_00735 [Bacteroidota bacterium]